MNSTSSQLFLGTSEVFSAVATLSNGTTAQVTNGAWSTDAPNVAQVDSGGRVTGAGSGAATISVVYQGTRGSRQIRVLPNYQGNWVGSYVVQTCTETQEFQNPDFCAAIFPIGRVLTAVFLFTQSGTTVSGRAVLGQISSGNSTAEIQDNGSMSFPDTATLSPSTFAATWNVNQAQAGTITGTLHIVVTSSVLLGTVTMDANVILQPASSMTSGGPAENPTPPQSLADLAGMLRAPGR